MIGGIPTWLFYLGIAALPILLLATLTGGWRVPATSAPWRLDLLRSRPLRAVLVWRPFRFLLQLVTVVLFVLIILAGLFGAQTAGKNMATVLTWTIWWALLILLIPFVGKAWCFVCPWDAISSWLERLSLWGVKPYTLSSGRPWPRRLRNIYVAVMLFLGLTWLELGYGVTGKPAWTAYLALLILFLALAPALFFERRSFCRYGCLIGRISGLYALFSAVEIRARDKSVCHHKCRSKDCYHGNARGYACPTFQYLAGMEKNTYCIFCGECFQTCPHDNVALNLRPPGADLTKGVQARFDEAAMVIVMVSMTAFHGITMTPAWGGLIRGMQTSLRIDYLAAFSLGMGGTLICLSAAYMALLWLSSALRRPANGVMRLAVRYSYALVPVALFYHLAHNTAHFVSEAGVIVPMLSDPFGWGWNILGTAVHTPIPLAPVWLVWAMQVALVLLGCFWSLRVAARLGEPREARSKAISLNHLPVLLSILLYSFLSLWLLAQPMEMRTGL